MICYKGFNKDMTCKGFQYAEGEEYEHSGAVKLCESGFHACEAPLDCFHYYPPATSVYHEVEQDGEIERKKCTDTKMVSSKIKIGGRLNIFGLINAQIEYVKSKCTKEHKDDDIVAANDHEIASVPSGGVATAGYMGVAQVEEYGIARAGHCGAATAGDCGMAQAWNRGVAQAFGHGLAYVGVLGAATAGDGGMAYAGDGGMAYAGYGGMAYVGDYGMAQAGDFGIARAACHGVARAGEHGTATSRGTSIVGKNGIACARGNNVKVKGGLGAVLVLVEENNYNYNIAAWKVIEIDGEIYKADTFYAIVNGEIKEVLE